MEKLKSSLAAKIAAVVLLIVSLACCVAGFAGMAVMDAAGGYQMPEEDMLKKAYGEVCRRYSVVALADYLDQYDADERMMTNFRYGIIKAKSLDEVDVTNPDSYVASNFETVADTKELRLEKLRLEELHLEEFDVGEDTYFEIGGNNILDTYYTTHSAEYSDIGYHIDDWLYDRETKTFYVRSEDGLFPIPADGGKILLEREDGYDERPLQTAQEMSAETVQGEELYVWRDTAEVLFYEGEVTVDINDIRIVDGKLDKLENYGEVQEHAPDYFAEGAFYVRHKNKSDRYIVASYVKEPLEGIRSFSRGDLFVQSEILISFAYRMRYAGIFLAIISLMVLLGAFSFLMASAGHHKGREGIHPLFLDYIPLDVYATGVFFAEIAAFCLGVSFMDSVIGWRRNSLSGFVTGAVLLICTGIAAILLGIAFCMSFAVRVKMGKWWRHTLTYMILKKCVQIPVKATRFCIYLLISLCRSVTLLWKAWFVLGALAFVEFMALEVNYADSGLFMVWLMEKMVLYPVIILALMQMNRLQKGARQIAQGQLDYQIDTRHMFWEMKKHGEYLNDIGYGINCAVNERMKSEHFKTELITNVSHDIKTPLTSIINYVDLLQKEEIHNPVVQEYLEVLHRQSARLKKLIEDLMEASKASTGSLNVIMEKCDAGVMLIQTIGEFEEKLMAEQIELQIKKPETDIYIEADNRHLWRVFDNLMNNICKYAQPSTRAYVNLEQNGQQAVIIFRNISRYQLNISSEELMERFVRGDSSRNTEGSGLGISIAKSLTELMNGTFDLTVDGDLFKVTLTFPLYGMMSREKELPKQQLVSDQNHFEKKDVHMLDSLSSGIQNAGSCAAQLGQGVADKTGRMVRLAGKYAQHVHQAIRQVKAEEMAQADVQNAVSGGENDTFDTEVEKEQNRDL